MTRTVVTHNHFHIGDNLIFLHLLRKLSQAHPDASFRHFAHGHILSSVAPVVEDCSNVELFSFEADQWTSDRSKSIDTWKNAEDQWVKSPVRWSWSDHALEHHSWTAKRMGFRSPFSHRDHLLFDYPALGSSPEGTPERWATDFLFVNSDPMSGQLSPMHHPNSGYLNSLIAKIGNRFSAWSTQEAVGAICTRGMGHTVSMIGKLSVTCKHHIMVATGPMWPTMNTHNNHLNDPTRRRIVILDNGEKLNMPGIEQVSGISELERIATKEGWI